MVRINRVNHYGMNVGDLSGRDPSEGRAEGTQRGFAVLVDARR